MEHTATRKAFASPPLTILKLTLLFMLLFFAFPLMNSFAQEPAPAAVSLDPQSATEQQLFQRINEVRASYGLAALEWDSRLATAADVHVTDMATNGNRSHRGRDGSSYSQRISRTGYLAAATNEAIGWGYNLDRQINWWLNSRVHRPILLSPSLKQVGIGYIGDPSRQWGHWWVVDFGTHQ